MSTSDALLNIAVFCVVMPLPMLLARWAIRQTPLQGLSGAEKWRNYRIRIGAGGMLLLGAGMMLYFLFHLIASLLRPTS